MGVTGLWRLIEPSGKPVPLETLENKILAIDVSIWLHQAIKGFQDSQGAPLPNAHLLGIYHRLCKLLYFRIKPIFVFDGGVPCLKRETIIKRQQQRSKKLNEAERIQKQLLTTLLKHTAVKNVLSEKTKATLTSPKTSPIKAKESEDLYKLPPTDFNLSVTSSDEETSTSDSSPTKNWDLHTINEKSEHFKSLPPDVRHDILTELKETRKQSSWGKIHEMPKNSDDFSGFQMKRLLKRYSVQASLDEATQEMGGHSLSLAELEALLNDQGVVTTLGSHIASDENARYLLIKDMKKAMEKAKLQEAKETELQTDTEYKRTLETAIQLSLQDLPGTSTSEDNKPFIENFCDGDFESLSDNSDSEKTASITKNLTSAKNYMIEYSGLTPTEIDKIISKNNITKSKETSPKGIVNVLVANHINKPKSDSDVLLNSSDTSDEEFLEVEEITVLKTNTDNEDPHLEIVIKPDEVVQEDNLFSDIFTNITKTTKTIENENRHNSGKDVNIVEELPIMQGDMAIPACNDKENNANILPISSEVDILKSDAISLNTSVTVNKKLSTVTIDSTNITVNKKLSTGTIDSTNIKISEEETLSHNKEIGSKDSCVVEGLIPSPSVSSMNEPNIQETDAATSLSHDATPNPTRLTTEDLQEMSRNLRNENAELEAGRFTNERLANNLTDQIYQEAQELLQLFGVPYIIAPMEAEAQCAFLNNINLTDGTITDDSDIWLFGGKTVYKNFFNQRKHVLEYRSESIHQHFKLTREQMILLALLVGSDYTTGLQGVGPVTALEILAKFPPTDDFISGLSTFRKWLSSDQAVRNLTLRNKLKNVTFTDGFPSIQVANAYLEPTVDSSKEAFSWSKPNINGLLEFARQKFGWNRVKSEEILKPVLKRLNENISQKSIKDYFQTKHKIDGGVAEAKMSKRVKKAIEAIGQGGDNIENDVGPKQRSRKILHNSTDGDLAVLKKTLVQSKKKMKEIETKIEEEFKKPKVAPDLHKKEVIPQKEKDKVDALRTKLKAIEVLRKLKRGPKDVKKRMQLGRKFKTDAELSESSSSD